MPGETDQKLERELDRCFLPRELLSRCRMADGRVYSTYCAWLKEEYWLEGQPSSAIIKELPSERADVYGALSHICHPNLETVYGTLEGTGRCCAVSEYILPPSCSDAAADGGNSLSLERLVTQYGGSLDGHPLTQKEKERQALTILLQLCEGLQALEEAGFIHGDIHPGNILLTDAPGWFRTTQSFPSDLCAKLIDFGNTQTPKGTDHPVTHVMGTRPFAAPEILDFSHPLDRTDIYSLGCILYYCLNGKSPKDLPPERGRLQTPRVRRIFRRCTASYEARYRSLKALRTDLLHTLQSMETPSGSLLWRLPGFRSHTIWKMAAASWLYLAIVIILEAGILDLLRGNPSDPIGDFEMIAMALWLLLEIFALTDAFQLGERFPRYAYLKRTTPLADYLVRILTAILLFVGCAFLLFLI